MFAPPIARMCPLLCAPAFSVGGHPQQYDPYSTHAVWFFGVQVGVHLDDTQPHQCQHAATEQSKRQLVIAGNAPAGWPNDQCPAATVNALEWGKGWSHLPRSNAYILESGSLGPLTWPAPSMTRRAVGYRSLLIIVWR